MRRSTVLSLPLQLVFPGCTNVIVIHKAEYYQFLILLKEKRFRILLLSVLENFFLRH